MRSRPKIVIIFQNSKLTFGREGKPYFMSGPYDDTNQTIQTLCRLLLEKTIYITRLNS